MRPAQDTTSRSHAPSPPADDLLAMLRAAPDAYLVLTPDFTIIAATDAYLALTMTTRDAVVGRHVFEVFPDDPGDPSASGAASVAASFQRVLAAKMPDTLALQRYPIRSASGTYEERFWRARNVPVLDDDGRVRHILHCVEDITAFVRQQNERSEMARTLQGMTSTSERYVRLLDAAPDAIVVVGPDGRIRLVNVQTELLFGYGREDLVGQPLELLIPERFRRAHVGHLNRYFADPAARPMGSRLELYGRQGGISAQLRALDAAWRSGA